MHIDQSLADKMVATAIAECAEARFDGNSRRVEIALMRGQCEECRFLSESLVKQISIYISQVDSTVKAVYKYEAIDDLRISPGTDKGTSKGVHIVIWVERKSAALYALVEALQTSLVASQRRIGCINASPDCYTIDIAVVDNHEVNERRGFGLLVETPYLRSSLVWSRLGQSQTIEQTTTESASPRNITLPETFDPELIPERRLIDHALTIERVPPGERANLQYHLTELKVTLIRRMISDQLGYINIAKGWFSVGDLAEIYERRIGFGQIGGKSAGMLLAWRILREAADEIIQAGVQVPESFFLGSDLMYIFMAMNGLMHWNDQKYRPEDQIRADYPEIQEQFLRGEFPPEVLGELQKILKNIGQKPLIVRSSSQLEDNFGTSFAGKYNSYFCPNQGSPEENLTALTQAVARTYASTLRPEALLYRRSKGLQDYDERMAILIQEVQGEQFGRYFLPHVSGVAFSHNLFRWAPQIRREDGFARIVWGLGTRAVERVGDDYPRLVALSHPTIQPDDSTEAIRYYSQRYVDVIDVEKNAFKTLPVFEVLKPDYPPIRLLVQQEKDGFFSTPRMRIAECDIPRLALTFDELLSRTNFASNLTTMLRTLEEHYHRAVDLEFTISISDTHLPNPKVMISLLQCRPQSHFQGASPASIPEDLSQERVLFSTEFMVPQGYLSNIRYILFVSPENYFALPTTEARKKIGDKISQLNNLLGIKNFICIGPGRWGSTNLDLGVYVSYADINNAGALVELSGRELKSGPEPSLGTHFFQDLMEAQIYPLAVNLDDDKSHFNTDIFIKSSNALRDWVEADQATVQCLRLIDIHNLYPGHHLEIVMDNDKNQAIGFICPDA